MLAHPPGDGLLRLGVEYVAQPRNALPVEDGHLGKLCYLRVMEHFFSEMERYRYTAR